MDQTSINEMAKILAIMNASPDALTESYDEAPELSETSIAPAPALSNPSTDAMRDILLKMHSVQNTVSNIKDSAKIDRTLGQALVTESTKTGTRIGSWEIVKHDNLFDVLNTKTGEAIASNLMLYEAAVSLAKNLNEGISITDKRVRDVLILEEDYVRNCNDAATYKNSAKVAARAGNDTKAAIAEDRYDGAQARALEAHDRILALAGLSRR